MARTKKNKAVDLNLARSGLGAATEVLDEALNGPTETGISRPAPDTVEKKSGDGATVRVHVRNRDPYSYKKRVRRFLSERGQPIPDHLRDEGADETDE